MRQRTPILNVCFRFFQIGRNTLRIYTVLKAPRLDAAHDMRSNVALDAIADTSSFLPHPLLSLAALASPTMDLDADPMQVLRALLRLGTLVYFFINDTSSQTIPEADSIHNIELLNCLVVVHAIKDICDAHPMGWNLSNHDDASALKQSAINSIVGFLNSVDRLFNVISSGSQTNQVGTKSASKRLQLLVNGAFNCPTQMMNQIRDLVVPRMLKDLDENSSARNLVIHFAFEKNALGDQEITMHCQNVSVVQQKSSGLFKLQVETVTTALRMVWDGKGAADFRSLIQRIARPDEPDAVDVDEIMSILRPMIV
jgi:hypothetical protein